MRKCTFTATQKSTSPNVEEKKKEYAPINKKGMLITHIMPNNQSDPILPFQDSIDNCKIHDKLRSLDTMTPLENDT